MLTSKRLALLVAALGSFASSFMASSVNIALPSIGMEFAIDAVLLSWVTTSYVLALAMLLVPFGRLGDIYGRKKLFVYGTSLFALSSLLSALSSSAAMLVSFRALQGVGGAMFIGAIVAILTSVFPTEERGEAFGANVAAVYLGLSLGPFLGGVLTQNFGWRSVFLAGVPPGLAASLLSSLKLKGEWVGDKGKAFDFAGSALYSLSLLALIYGFSSLPSALAARLIFAGALGILAFVWWESKVGSPVLDLSLFRGNRPFSFSNLAALIGYTSTFAVTFLLSLYLQYVKGLTPQTAGLILISQPVMMATFSPLAGKLSDRVEPRDVSSIGIGLTAASLLALTFLNEKTSLKLIIASLILLGLGFAFFSSPNTNAAMASVERKFYGVAAAALGTMRSAGQTLSMGVATLMLATYLGRVQITPAHYSAFLEGVNAAFAVFAALCFAGALVSIARGKTRAP